MKPRIFLGLSAKQEKLLQALTRGLQDIADVDAWMTVFNPGVSTLSRLVELTREVDFAALVFAQVSTANAGFLVRGDQVPEPDESQNSASGMTAISTFLASASTLVSS